MNPISSPLGLIAGNGAFPLEFAESAKAQGREVVALAHVGETDSALEGVVKKCVWVKVGQLGKIIRVLKASSVKQAAFVGGIRRVRLFGGMWPDFRGMLFLARLVCKRDDSVLRALASELERSGIEVIAASTLLPSSVPKSGQLTKRGLTDSEKRDALIGFDAARAIGAVDIGQTVVTCDGLIVAVEAIEGTDAALKRAGELTGKKGGVVVKLCKLHQDTRFDLPSIGLTTIQTMHEAGLTALVLEAGRSMILNPSEVVCEADRLGISILVVEGKQEIA